MVPSACKPGCRLKYRSIYLLSLRKILSIYPRSINLSASKAIYLSPHPPPWPPIYLSPPISSSLRPILFQSVGTGLWLAGHISDQCRRAASLVERISDQCRRAASLVETIFPITAVIGQNSAALIGAIDKDSKKYRHTLDTLIVAITK